MGQANHELASLIPPLSNGNLISTAMESLTGARLTVALGLSGSLAISL